MQPRATLCLLCACLLFPACTRQTVQTGTLPRVVPHVDLARYSGTWYEIARTPNNFQEGCRESTVTYTLLNGNRIAVVNQCRRHSFDSQTDSVRGKARVVDRGSNAKLKVSYFWPFSSDYWIIDLGERYDYAVVATPDRKYLWILSRTPLMDEQLYQAILGRIDSQGFDTKRLLKSVEGAITN